MLTSIFASANSSSWSKPTQDYANLVAAMKNLMTSTTLAPAERELPKDRNGQANSNCLKRTSLENMINTKTDTLEEVLLLKGRTPCSRIRFLPHASAFALLILSTVPSQGQNVATDTDGERIILGENSAARLFNDVAYVFVRDGAGWREEGKLASGGFGHYGNSVAIRGTRAAVSAPAGMIRVFDLIGASWVMTSDIDPEQNVYWEFLKWVDDGVLVGAGNVPGGAVVQVHEWNGASWQQTSLTPSDEPGPSSWSHELFEGGGIAATDSIVVVGNWNQVTPGGAAYVFGRTEGGWARDTTLVPTDASLTLSPTVSGSTLYVRYRPTRGGDSRDTAVFELNAATGQWEETQTLLDVWFNVVDGNRAASLTSGSAVVLDRDPATGAWQETVRLDPNASFFDGFVSLDLAGQVLVGAYNYYGRGTDPFQADVFVLDTLTGEWRHDTTLTGTPPPQPITGGKLACVNNMAGPFPCDRVDLLSYLPVESMGGVVTAENGFAVVFNVGDVWGWTSGTREFALVTDSGGLVFVEVTDPQNPAYIGYIPARCGTGSSCRLFRLDDRIPDVRVYRHVAFLSAGEGRHRSGWPLLAFDLRRLTALTGQTCQSSSGETRDGVCFAADASLDADNDESRFLVGAMNLAVNQASGFLYATEAVIEGHSGPVVDLAFVDLSDPLDPIVVGSYDDPDDDAHEVQCVIYDGPDTDYAGREVCFLSAGSAFQIVDVTDKVNPARIASVSPAEVGFHHQGQLTTDHQYFYMADAAAQGNTRTIIWDVTDLDNPSVSGFHDGPTMAAANTVYIDESLAFLAAKENGVRVFDVSADVTNPIELGWFDTLPATDESVGHGAWSAYPYFPSGNLVVASGHIEFAGQGLFILRPTDAPVSTESSIIPDAFSLAQNYPNPFHSTAEIAFSLHLSGKVRINVYDVLGRHVGRLVDQHLVPGRHTVTWDARGLPPGVYLYRLTTRSETKARTAILLK